MHEHDLDLIAAHAEGSAPDPALAAELVATCDTCRREYQSQVAVLGLLRATPSVAMTAEEKTMLERELRTVLTAPGRAATAGNKRWWYRLGYGAVAAMVLVVIGYAALPRGGGDGAIFTEMAGDQSITTTAEAGEPAAGPYGELAEDADLELLLDEFLAAPPPESQAPADRTREAAESCLEAAGLELASILYTEDVEIGGASYLLAASGAADDPDGHVVDALICETVFSTVKPAGQTPD